MTKPSLLPDSGAWEFSDAVKAELDAARACATGETAADSAAALVDFHACDVAIGDDMAFTLAFEFGLAAGAAMALDESERAGAIASAAKRARTVLAAFRMTLVGDLQFEKTALVPSSVDALLAMIDSVGAVSNDDEDDLDEDDDE